MATAPLGTTGDASDSAAPRGSAGRVAVVQRQARFTLGLAGGFAVAATVALVVPHRTGDWLALHLFLVGAVLLAISAATQLFAVTWAAGTPPSDRVAAIQRWLLVAGIALLATARELQWPSGLVAAGGALVVAALVVLGVSLERTVSGGVQRRFDVALRSYLAALAAGLAGCALGIAMATGLDAPMNSRVRAAHLTLNLLGLVGLVIAGTLPFFTATQTRVKMSPRAGGRAQSLVLARLVERSARPRSASWPRGRSSPRSGSVPTPWGSSGWSRSFRRSASSSCGGPVHVSCSSAREWRGGSARRSRRRVAGRRRNRRVHSDRCGSTRCRRLRADHGRRSCVSRTRAAGGRSSAADGGIPHDAVVAGVRRGERSGDRIGARCARSRRSRDLRLADRRLPRAPRCGYAAPAGYMSLGVVTDHSTRRGAEL